MNKWDSDFGVASMTTLFWVGRQEGTGGVSFRNVPRCESPRGTVGDVGTEVPKGHKTDAVMALWFAELACRDRIAAVSSFNRSHQRSPFATRWDRRQQHVVNVSDMSNMWA